MARNGKLETTLGDFIVALTDAAERQVHDDKMSYELVAYILSDRFARAGRLLDLLEPSDDFLKAIIPEGGADDKK